MANLLVCDFFGFVVPFQLVVAVNQIVEVVLRMCFLKQSKIHIGGFFVFALRVVEQCKLVVIAAVIFLRKAEQCRQRQNKNSYYLYQFVSHYFVGATSISQEIGKWSETFKPNRLKRWQLNFGSTRM